MFFKKGCSEQVSETLFKKKVGGLFYPLNTSENHRFSDVFRGYRRPATLLKKRLWHRCFPVNFAEFLRKHILKNMCERLLFSRMQRRYDLKKRFDHKIELKTYFISFFSLGACKQLL